MSCYECAFVITLFVTFYGIYGTVHYVLGQLLNYVSLSQYFVICPLCIKLKKCQRIVCAQADLDRSSSTIGPRHTLTYYISCAKTYFYPVPNSPYHGPYDPYWRKLNNIFSLYASISAQETYSILFFCFMACGFAFVNIKI